VSQGYGIYEVIWVPPKKIKNTTVQYPPDAFTRAHTERDELLHVVKAEFGQFVLSLLAQLVTFDPVIAAAFFYEYLVPGLRFIFRQLGFDIPHPALV